MAIMTEEEKAILLDQMNKASESGDREEFIRIAKKIPVPPEVALAYKEGFGADYVANSGFNLSEAEEEYGKDWLSH